MSTLDEIQMSARIRIEEPDEIETSGPAAELDTSALYTCMHAYYACLHACMRACIICMRACIICMRPCTHA